jgi:hypothetical protein
LLKKSISPAASSWEAAMADATSCEITTLTPKITEDEEPYLLVHLESDNLTVEVERRLLVALHKEIKDL